MFCPNGEKPSLVSTNWQPKHKYDLLRKTTIREKFKKNWILQINISEQNNLIFICIKNIWKHNLIINQANFLEKCFKC